MTKSPLILAFLALSTLACATADAKRIAIKPVQSVVKSPYTIELVDASGQRLETYNHRGRFYVNGEDGERYSIRISNPTDRRIEAVISVDGLDVIDGETADYRSKRGYIVPARGDLVIDGYRVSTQSVAAFRFSSVSASYAGRKGKARNVGVVGVAIFAEKAQPEIVVPVDSIAGPFPRPDHRHKHRHGSAAPRPRHDLDSESLADDMPAEPSSVSGLRPSSVSGRGRVERSVRRPAEKSMRRQERSGLGTSFGERRHSAVSFTRFVRANAKRPTSFAELRYNNASGLLALGIRLRSTIEVSQEELATRESADAFPGTRFAQPPR